MEGMISVKEVLKTTPELESVLGYTEERMEDLVINGDLTGRYHPQSGELWVDKAVIEDLVSICRELVGEAEEQKEE